MGGEEAGEGVGVCAVEGGFRMLVNRMMDCLETRREKERMAQMGNVPVEGAGAEE